MMTGIAVVAPASLDLRILAWLHEARHPLLDAGFGLVTWLGSLWVLVPAALAWGAWKWRTLGWRSALIPAGALAGASLTVWSLKAAVLRPRPDLFEPLATLPVDSSFPSGHAAQASAVALALAWHGGRAARMALLLALTTVAVSRPYLQVHFPSDVIAGMAIGAAWAWVFSRIRPEVARS